MTYKNPVCRGSFMLGTACGRCERCNEIRNLGRVIAEPPVSPSLFREACERIADMLRQDDGEAFFEAEKFLKRNAPDLYDKIGMNPELGEGLRTEAEAQAEDEQK